VSGGKWVMMLIDCLEQYKAEEEISPKMLRHLSELLKREALGKKSIEWAQSHMDEMNRIVSYFARSYFDEREDVIKSINCFMKYLKKHGFKYNDDRFCQLDKIYRGDEMKIKLLKFLQQPCGNRENIAEHFNMSTNAINIHMSELQDGINILGSNVKISPKRGTNEYDSTIHPVFLALNLSEVFTLTIVLKSVTSKGVFADIANDIADDVYRQLTEYGKSVIDKRANEAGVQFGDSKGVYRQEIDEKSSIEEILNQKNRHRAYLLKSGSPCKVFYSENTEPMCGVLQIHPKDESKVILVQKDGSKTLLDWDRIVRIISER